MKVKKRVITGPVLLELCKEQYEQVKGWHIRNFIMHTHTIIFVLFWNYIHEEP